MKTNIIPIELIRERLSYDPDTGVFQWKVQPKRGHSREFVGYTRKDGYLIIKISQQPHLGHRLAWLLMTGDQPPAQIDHIDRDPSNNRWNNLRDGTDGINALNRGITGAGPITGVTRHKAKGHWRARYRNREVYSGYNLFEACCARKSAELKSH